MQLAWFTNRTRYIPTRLIIPVTANVIASDDYRPRIPFRCSSCWTFPVVFALLKRISV